MNKLYVLLIIFVKVIIFGVFYNYSQKELEIRIILFRININKSK